MEIISQYTDEQAVEDGLLGEVKIVEGKEVIDRATSALLGAFKSPVAHTLLGIMAMRFGEKDGDSMKILKGTNKGDVWLVKNERNNWTLMFPSDY